MFDPMPRKNLKLLPMVGKFVACAIGPDSFGDTEIIMQDIVMIWERWDERTEIATTPEGLLVGVRLNEFNVSRQEGE